MKKIILCLTVVLVAASFAVAAQLHVGSGQTYATIQQAWGDCSNGDEIIVHAGVYPKIDTFVYNRDPNDANGVGDPNDPNDYNWRRPSPWVLSNAYDGNGIVDPCGILTPTFPIDHNDIWIHSAGDGKVVLKGEIKIHGTTTGNTKDITIEGFYIDTSFPSDEQTIHRSAVYFSTSAGPPATSLGACTVRDCVIYNGKHEYSSSYTDQGIHIREKDAGTHGPHVVEHCTIVNLSGSEGTGYAYYDKADHSSAPVFRSNIVGNFERGTWTRDVGDQWKYANFADYCNVYSTDPNSAGAGSTYQSNKYMGIHSYSMDPVFVSTDPNHALFLMLGPDSPNEIKFGAHDGGPMGARLEKMGFDPNDCGFWGIKQGDKNGDCYVDFDDFAIVSADWMDCTHPDCP